MVFPQSKQIIIFPRTIYQIGPFHLHPYYSDYPKFVDYTFLNSVCEHCVRGLDFGYSLEREVFFLIFKLHYYYYSTMEVKRKRWHLRPLQEVFDHNECSIADKLVKLLFMLYIVPSYTVF